MKNIINFTANTTTEAVDYAIERLRALHPHKSFEITTVGEISHQEKVSEIRISLLERCENVDWKHELKINLHDHGFYSSNLRLEYAYGLNDLNNCSSGEQITKWV